MKQFYWHEHHIIPKHEGGSDNKDNLVKVNIAMHAFLHAQRYYDYGLKEDKLAADGLKGLISKAEITQELARQNGLNHFKNKTAIFSDESKDKAKKATAAYIKENGPMVINLEPWLTGPKGLHRENWRYAELVESVWLDSCDFYYRRQKGYGRIKLKEVVSSILGFNISESTIKSMLENYLRKGVSFIRLENIPAEWRKPYPWKKII